MPKEIELKLSFPTANKENLSAFLEKEYGLAESKFDLRNTYFDTPELLLQQNRTALRIRRQGGRIIQTLKGGGKVEGGVHIRNEWEWELREEFLDLSLLNQTPLNLSIESESIKPIFTTDFSRTIWLLEVGEAEVELAFDCGSVVSGEQSFPISEIELELKTGDAKELFVPAARIASAETCWLYSESKAQRGYQLYNLSDVPAQEFDLDDYSSAFDLVDLWGNVAERIVNRDLQVQPHFPAEILHGILLRILHKLKLMPAESVKTDNGRTSLNRKMLEALAQLEVMQSPSDGELREWVVSQNFMGRLGLELIQVHNN